MHGLLVALLLGITPGLSPAPDVLKAPRPKGGEYFGLYLVDKKVGYVFQDLTLAPGHPEEAVSTNEIVFKAAVGTKQSERRHKEVRVYQAKPHGKLLRFTIEDHGDGGEQRLEGKASAAGFSIVRTRPGVASETLTIPAVKETVEMADAPRVLLLQPQPLDLVMLDGTDLSHYHVKSTLGPPEERRINGVQVTLRRVVTVSDKDKVPMESLITSEGALVEVSFPGNSLTARAEPQSIATRLDQVEIFGLTRSVLPKAFPADVRKVPNHVTLVMDGLPEKFQRPSFRQSFKKLPGGQVEVTLSAVPVSRATVTRPVKATAALAPYLESTIVVEAKDRAIQALAKKILAAPLEVNDNSAPWVLSADGSSLPAKVTLPVSRDAYISAKKLVGWVSANMKKDYGASADRATDVLRQLKGDCTEHSLLSEALLRAAGIPAKRVDGVIYLVNADGVPAFYWHEWVEAYVGEWTQLDPTFDEMVADATHLALGEESNAEITPLLGHLKVTAVR